MSEETLHSIDKRVAILETIVEKIDTNFERLNTTLDRFNQFSEKVNGFIGQQERINARLNKIEESQISIEKQMIRYGTAVSMIIVILQLFPWIYDKFI